MISSVYIYSYSVSLTRPLIIKKKKCSYNKTIRRLKAKTFREQGHFICYTGEAVLKNSYDACNQKKRKLNSTHIYTVI